MKAMLYNAVYQTYFEKMEEQVKWDPVMGPQSYTSKKAKFKTIFWGIGKR